MENLHEPKRGDAFGTALRDFLAGRETHYNVEREDGYLDPSSLAQYFLEFPEWGVLDRKMLGYARGRVLDIGCGAAKHLLHLQSLGYEVVGIDASPGACEVARQRGARQVFNVSIDELVRQDSPGIGEPFETVIMMGNNLGLLHSFEDARIILRWLHAHTAASARIIGMTRDLSKTTDPLHLAYQQWNRERGRMPGQIHFRIRHSNLATAWYDYLFVSERELSKILDTTGWETEKILKGEEGDEGLYVAVMRKI